MNCPHCAATLTPKFYKGMLEVDYCPQCRGMWLEEHELDRLEDTAFSQDEYKGSLLHRQQKSARPCPVCGDLMQEFQYRLYNLRLEFCPQRHGFWLDAGEEQRVLQIMRQRAAEVQRKHSAEAEWQDILKNLHRFFQEGL